MQAVRRASAAGVRAPRRRHPGPRLYRVHGCGGALGPRTPVSGHGLVTAFCRHTSASLTIQENADPDVQTDLLAGPRPSRAPPCRLCARCRGPGRHAGPFPHHADRRLLSDPGPRWTAGARHLAGALPDRTPGPAASARNYCFTLSAAEPVGCPRLDKAQDRWRSATSLSHAARVIHDFKEFPWCPLGSRCYEARVSEENRRDRREGTALQGQTSTIVIADDHPLFRGALRQAIGSLMPQTRVLEANGTRGTPRGSCLREGSRSHPPRSHHAGRAGVFGTDLPAGAAPEVPVVIVSASEEPTIIRRAIEFGASGFIPKSLDVDGIGAQSGRCWRARPGPRRTWI